MFSLHFFCFAFPFLPALLVVIYSGAGNSGTFLDVLAILRGLVKAGTQAKMKERESKENKLAELDLVDQFVTDPPRFSLTPL